MLTPRQVPFNVKKRGNDAENNARITLEPGEVNGGRHCTGARMRLKTRSLLVKNKKKS